MTERPIIFDGESVRAILAGRKTQTRRVVKPQPSESFEPSTRLVLGYYPTKVGKDGEEYPGKMVVGVADDEEGYVCPYGAGLDRLWVRETWCRGQTEDGEDSVQYRADGGKPFEGRWITPIHMPRWASRITLEVVSIRCERLHDITEEDAIAEGYVGEGVTRHGEEACCWFSFRWDTINGHRCPWDSNPWVWAIAFRRLT